MLFQVHQSLDMSEKTSRQMDACCVKEQQPVECCLREGGNFQAFGDGSVVDEGQTKLSGDVLIIGNPLEESIPRLE